MHFVHQKFLNLNLSKKIKKVVIEGQELKYLNGKFKIDTKNNYKYYVNNDYIVLKNKKKWYTIQFKV